MATITQQNFAAASAVIGNLNSSFGVGAENLQYFYAAPPQNSVMFVNVPQYYVPSTAHLATPSPPQGPVIFIWQYPPARTPVTASPVRHGGGNDSVRRLGTRREGHRHPVIPLRRGDNKTTVVIKNVPYHCCRGDLIEFLDKFCAKENVNSDGEDPGLIAAYDLIYLPIDFESKSGRGFAFVNFTHPDTAWKFYQVHDGQALDVPGDDDNSKQQRPMEIMAARLQGKEAMLDKYKNSKFDCGTDEFLPVLFEPARDGSDQVVETNVIGSRNG